MANSYLMFSFFAFDDLTPAECEWLEERQDPEWWETNHEEGYMGFDMDIEVVQASSHRLWIHADEAGLVDNVAWLLRHFLHRFRPRDRVFFEWSCFCDKPRVDEFGGGACLVTAREVAWFHPLSLAEKYAQGGECKPDIAVYGTAVDNLGDAIDDDDEGLQERRGEDRRRADAAGGAEEDFDASASGADR